MPKKKTKSRETVAIIGPGNVGRSLAFMLHGCGAKITEIITRDEGASRNVGAALARELDAKSSTITTAQLDAGLIWICVSDPAIAAVAAQLAERPVNWKGKIVLHASGPLLAAELAPLKKLGAATAAMHPMNSFLDGQSTLLFGTPFGAQGDERAIRTIERILRRHHRHDEPVYRIKAKHKVLYHALGAFSSPLLVSTLNVGERIGRVIGLRDTRALVASILLTSTHNFISGGSAGAFSGPIRRGDVATIRKHLTALAKVPGAKDVYRALALNAVEHLPAKNRAELRKLLKKKGK